MKAALTADPKGGCLVVGSVAPRGNLSAAHSADSWALQMADRRGQRTVVSKAVMSGLTSVEYWAGTMAECWVVQMEYNWAGQTAVSKVVLWGHRLADSKAASMAETTESMRAVYSAEH